MTLSTRIRIHRATPAREVFDAARALIGADRDDYQFEHHTQPRYAEDLNRSYVGGLGQGLPAWLLLHYGADGPLNDGPVEPGEEKYAPPAAFAEVDFDTAYGYSLNGAGCSDLHAWLVRELGAWCDERRLPWSWYDEFRGEWHTGADDLAVLGNADVGALR